MQINCELPLSMIPEWNEKLNQYDLVLFHLFISNSEYKKYFTELRRKYTQKLSNAPASIISTRRMIMDNSAWEFMIRGESHKPDMFRDAVKELGPDYFIIPDVLGNMDKTMDYVLSEMHYWDQGYYGSHSYPIAVIQGNSVEEFWNCIQDYLKLGIKCVAVPYDIEFFRSYAHWGTLAEKVFRLVYNIPTLTPDMEYALGRLEIISLLKSELQKFEYIHILGSHCVLDKLFLNHNPELRIRSMDTSYPVKIALKKWPLFKEQYKPKIVIDDIESKCLSPEIQDLIITNINTFKNI